MDRNGHAGYAGRDGELLSANVKAWAKDRGSRRNLARILQRQPIVLQCV
jgi:hypothetical protein